MTPATETPEHALQRLVGLRLQSIGRAVDMLWMQIGDLHEIPTRGGATRTVGEWAIHVQTPWRFYRGSTILLGNRDMYYYPSTGESYDWDVGGESRFDEYAFSLNAELSATPAMIERIACDAVGGFSMLLPSGLAFDAFPNVADASPNFEFWRLFQPGSDSPHFIAETEADDT